MVALKTRPSSFWDYNNSSVQQLKRLTDEDKTLSAVRCAPPQEIVDLFISALAADALHDQAATTQADALPCAA